MLFSLVYLFVKSPGVLLILSPDAPWGWNIDLHLAQIDGKCMVKNSVPFGAYVLGSKLPLFPYARG